jgi:hypothetical protein
MTTYKPRRRSAAPRLTTFVDADGVTCIRVPLANTYESAILWKADYDRLKAAGLSSYWCLNGNGHGGFYVRAKRPGLSYLMVARLVLDEPEGAIVRYANGDRLDLRRPNLYIARDPYAAQAAASLMAAAD